ncbi:efflux RND transporter periplasmic adaptor subunit [Rickettsiales bacterium LUAb2]
MKRNKVIIIIISILVILGSFVLAHILGQKPKVEAKPAAVAKTYVTVMRVSKGDFYPHIQAMGQVQATNQVDLKAEVSGKITEINKNFVPGGFIKKGDVIIKIEDNNYKLAYSQAKADYENANASYKKALGDQAQAREELQMYERSTGKKVKDSYLVLRKPALDQAAAELAKAQSALDRAKLDLSRTVIKAPFNSIVYSRNVSYSGYVTPDQAVASLVSTDSYWVNASIPVGDLKVIDFTNLTNKVLVTLSNNRGTRDANIFKLQNYLGDTVRYVGLLLTVDDPLLLKQKGKTAQGSTLLLGDYVKVNIEGKALKNVYRIPLYTLRDNSTIWIDDNGVLKVSEVKVEFQDEDYAYVTGLNDGDLIINSDISIVSPGMLLEIGE